MIILCIMMNQRPYLWLQTGARRKTNVSTFHTGGNCMTTQIAIVLGIIALMSISFFFELLPLGFTALMVPVLLQGTGILDAKTAWSGLSNTTVITWIGLFITALFLQKQVSLPHPRIYSEKHKRKSVKGLSYDHCRNHRYGTCNNRYCYDCSINSDHHGTLQRFRTQRKTCIQIRC